MCSGGLLLIVISCLVVIGLMLVLLVFSLCSVVSMLLCCLGWMLIRKQFGVFVGRCLCYCCSRLGLVIVSNSSVYNDSDSFISCIIVSIWCWVSVVRLSCQWLCRWCCRLCSSCSSMKLIMLVVSVSVVRLLSIYSVSFRLLVICMVSSRLVVSVVIQVSSDVGGRVVKEWLSICIGGILCRCSSGGRLKLNSNSRLMLVLVSVGIVLGSGRCCGIRLFSICIRFFCVVMFRLMLSVQVGIVSISSCSVRFSRMLCWCVFRQCRIVIWLIWCRVKWLVVSVVVMLVSSIVSSVFRLRKCLVRLKVWCMLCWVLFMFSRCRFLICGSSYWCSVVI